MDYDIIITGGGPAGLSLAAELSKEFRILIIDKKKIPSTTCSWYSYYDRIKKYGLEKAILNRCDGILYESRNYSSLMKDDCVVLDEKMVLKIWYDKAKNNGLVTKEALFIDARKTKNEVIVETHEKNYSARLLIDCTGIKSPILRRHKLVKKINTWLIYGHHISNIRLKDTKKISFLPVHDKFNTYIGLYPITKNTAKFYIFRNLESELGHFEDLEKVFDVILYRHFPKAKKNEVISGRIISGEIKRYALDNIVFFGESSMLNPPACGMGFNEILIKHREFADGIKNLMQKNALKAGDLTRVSLSVRDQKIINFQLIIAKFTYYFINSPAGWDGGVQWLNSLGDMSKYWMRNELSLEWIKNATFRLYKTIPLVEVVKVMPPKDYLFVTNQFRKFVHNSIKSEAENLLKKKEKNELE